MKIPRRTKQDIQDAERRSQSLESNLKTLNNDLTAILDIKAETLTSISDEEWQKVEQGDESEDVLEALEKCVTNKTGQLIAGQMRALHYLDMDISKDDMLDMEIAYMEARRVWQTLVDVMSDVNKLVHLAMRMDPVDEEQIRVRLLRIRKQAYEDELSIQAARAGCANRQGRLIQGPELSALNQMSIDDAASIANTYNYDLAAAVIKIRSEIPTANRYTYAKYLRIWHAERAKWKERQIVQYAEGTARTKAQQDFETFNRPGGEAILEPRSAVCPVCQGWINRGVVPLNVALNNPSPYHPTCPHIWRTLMPQFNQNACFDLWMGGG